MSINLLPWRERRRHRYCIRITSFVVITGVLICLMLVGANRWLNSRINYLARESNQLKQKISALSDQQHQVLQLQKNLIAAKKQQADSQQQQVRKDAFLSVIYKFSQQSLNTIYLTALAMTNKQIIVAGRATTQTALHQWLEDMTDSSIFNKPKLEKMQQLNGVLYPYQFVVHFVWK